MTKIIYSFVKFHGNKNGSLNMTMLYPNLCYNKVHNKGTALFVIDFWWCFLNKRNIE